MSTFAKRVADEAGLPDLAPTTSMNLLSDGTVVAATPAAVVAAGSVVTAGVAAYAVEETVGN